jgi:hypothetical protein
MDNMILGDGVSALDRMNRTSSLLFRARAYAARESPSLATDFGPDQDPDPDLDEDEDLTFLICEYLFVGVRVRGSRNRRPETVLSVKTVDLQVVRRYVSSASAVSLIAGVFTSHLEVTVDLVFIADIVIELLIGGSGAFSSSCSSST